jgi:hypothetical protein
VEHNDRGDASSSWRAGRLWRLQEMVFSLNLVSAFAYAALVYVFANARLEIPNNDVAYYFLRAGFRITDLLRLSPVNAVTTEAVARQHLGRALQVGEELTILITVLGVSLIVFLIVRFTATPAYRVILTHVSLWTALFAAPACFLWALRLSWQRGSEVVPSDAPDWFWQAPLVAIFVGEILCVGVLLLISRSRSISIWTMGVLMFFHFVFWVPVLWAGLTPFIYRLLTPYLLLMAFPLSGTIWLSCFKRLRSDVSGIQHPRRASKWTLAGSAALLALVVYLWSPNKTHTLTNPANLNSVTVSISRGPCHGGCPSYRVVIHGTGQVEYVGFRLVKIREPQKAVVSSEDVSKILAELDRTQFFTIEDRAFSWCFDTPSVAVSWSVDGGSKTVVSDSYCTGSKSGVQARFVQAAAEIEHIVDSERWVKCEGRCRN